MNEHEANKKATRTYRIIILVVVFGVFTQAELHSEVLPSILKSSESTSVFTSFILVFGAAIAGLWLMFEIATAIDRDFKSRKIPRLTTGNTENKHDAKNHTTFRLTQPAPTVPKQPKTTQSTLKWRTSNQTIVVTGLLVFVLSGFYWFSIRPSNIRKECSKIASEASRGASDWIKIPYTEETLGTYNNPSRLVTRYKTERVDKSAETYSAAYTACTNSKGVQ